MRARLAHGGVQAVAVTAGLDRIDQPSGPWRLGQVACATLQLDGSKEAREHCGEQLGCRRHAWAPVQRLTWQASLDGEDGAAGLPHADVLGRRVAASAQLTDNPDQPPLVLSSALGARHQLDDELLTAGRDGKGRTGLPAQRLIDDRDAVDASETRHRIQELLIGLSYLMVCHGDQ